MPPPLRPPPEPPAVEPVPVEEVKLKVPRTDKGKADLVDNTRNARKTWVDATAHVVALRKELSLAIIAEAQALKGMQAAQRVLKQETEDDV